MTSLIGVRSEAQHALKFQSIESRAAAVLYTVCVDLPFKAALINVFTYDVVFM